MAKKKKKVINEDVDEKKLAEYSKKWKEIDKLLGLDPEIQSGAKKPDTKNKPVRKYYTKSNRGKDWYSK